MNAPDTLAETKVATFVDAFPDRTLEVIAYGLRLGADQVSDALTTLMAKEVVRRRCCGSFLTFYPTGMWSPEWE